MGDIVIHRCTLRLIRHGGWSWGPNPRMLLENATKMLPELIAEKLAVLLSDHEDLEITQPVRLAFKIKLADLLNGGKASSERVSGQPDPWQSTISDAKKSKSEITKTDEFTARAPPKRDLSKEIIGTRLPSRKVPFLPLLLDWWERGVLQRMLGAFTAPALALWHDHLFSQLPRTGSVKPETILSFAREITAKQKEIPVNFSSWLRLRITVAVAILARQGVQVASPLLRQVLDQLLPDKVSDTRERHVAKASATGVFEARTESDTVACGDIQICSVLPFLMLGVLSRLGYLDVLSATLSAAGLEKHANHFAIALAHKALPAPKRGWHREPLAQGVAAAFAGVNQSPPEPALAAFGRQIADALSPLDRILAVALAEGHNPNQPLLLHRLDKPRDSLMLFDVEGCFPVVWHEDLSMVLDAIRDFGPVTVLVTEDAATPVVLRKLSDEKVRYITAAPPGRGETWRVFHAPSRYWTNDHESPDTRLIRIARLLPQATQLTEGFIGALITERPAIAPLEAPALERSVTLAAGAALGTIAWTLWHDKGSTDPVLALERFVDLDGRVTFASDAVRVRVPLGRRHQDLREHGFLADIAGVPWFGGRVVEFPGI